MSLTYQEELRLSDIEDQVENLTNLLAGAASKNMLNRLLTLANRENNKIEDLITALTTQVAELKVLAQKLQ
jgi:hypothetical protein